MLCFLQNKKVCRIKGGNYKKMKPASLTLEAGFVAQRSYIHFF